MSSQSMIKNPRHTKAQLKGSKAGASKSKQFLSWHNPEDQYEMIAQAAYYKAEQRDFAAGYEVIDWLEAEQELKDMFVGD